MKTGEWTGETGIIVKVTQKVNQGTLPPEDRIPDCLEGVAVQIRKYSEDERPPLALILPRFP